MGSIHAANHAVMAAASLLVQCDSGDLNTEHFSSGPPGSKSTGVGMRCKPCMRLLAMSSSSLVWFVFARILIYDCKPGGVGVCESLYESLTESTRCWRAISVSSV